MAKKRAKRIHSAIRSTWGDQRSRVLAVGFILVFAGLGVYFLTASHAASPFASSEAEGGQLGSGASLIGDANASGGSAVKFGGGGSGVTGGTDTSCQFKEADLPLHVAFCEGFDTAQTTPNTSNRSGDLLAPLWGVSRIEASPVSTSNLSQGQVGNWFPTNMQGCGNNGSLVFPTSDVRICNGQFVESVNDGGTDADGQTILAEYPRQPFDIAGRTGTAVFDITNDSQNSHAAWPTWCYTDQPVPAPSVGLSGVAAYPRNGVCVQLTLQCGTMTNPTDPIGTQVGVENIDVFRNYQSTNYGVAGSCVNKASATNLAAGLNHFEIRISQSTIQVYGSDPGGSNLHLLSELDNANLTLTRGLTWMTDVHYNGCKFDTQCDHTFVWDNFGFDGPSLDRDMGFDVPDDNSSTQDPTGQYPHIVQLGYDVGSSATTLQVKGVHELQTPSGAIVIFNWNPQCNTVVPSISVNGNAYIDSAWPFPASQGDGGPGNGCAWATIAVPVPLSEIKTDGTSVNTIAFKTSSGGGGVIVSNVDLILIGASPAPSF